MILRKEGKGKQASIFKILPPISPRPSKNILAKSKYYKKHQSTDSNSNFNKLSYAQVSKSNIKNIIKIKEVFP